MNIIRVMRDVARELRKVRMLSIDGDLDELAQQLDDAVEDPERAVDLAICIGFECIKLHGLRVATWRGIGPSSIYSGVCDECHAERLTAEEREHMVELFGAAWVRYTGLHKLHLGRVPMEEKSAKPWNWCPKCEQTVDDDMRTGEFRDGSEGTCIGCGTVYVAVAYEGGAWALVSRESEEDDHA